MQQETIAGQQVYTALLINGNEQLYTGWWYDNGIEHVNWLVNVTAGNKQQLIREIEAIISTNRLKPLL